LFDIPGYRTLRKIGEGGAAEVYLVLREENRQKAALKLLHAKYGGDPAMRKRLAREAEIIGGLRHPNIVRIFRFGSLDQRFYTIMEYLAKGSLEAGRRLSPRDRLKVMIQVCDGVAYIHSLGIVHRDLKPSNIMFGDDGIPRLVDFGISLFSQENYTRLTQTNLVMGTLSYMSPEQQTDPAAVDARSDIYSLGAMLYELFTGQKPVGRFPDPRELDPGFDPELERCILRCLAARPQDRWAKAEQLQERLIALWREGSLDDGSASRQEPFDTRIGYWVQKLRHGGVGERLEARRRIAENALPEDAPELVRLCESSETEVRAAVVPVLGALRRPEAFDFLIGQLADPVLCRESCRALAQLGDARAVAPLAQIAKKRAAHAYSALAPLAVLGGEKSLKLAAPYLKSKSVADRDAALRALELAGTKRWLRELKKYLKQESVTELRNRAFALIQKWEMKA